MRPAPPGIGNAPSLPAPEVLDALTVDAALPTDPFHAGVQQDFVERVDVIECSLDTSGAHFDLSE